MDKAIYDGLRWHLQDEKLVTFDNLIGGIKNSLVLDAGAGERSTLAQFLCERGAVIMALDKSTEEMKSNPYTKIQADAERLPFQDNSFDLVVCTEVLEHLKKPDQVVKEAFRVSRQVCLFSVPREPIFSILSAVSGKYWSRLGKHPEHRHFWTKTSFERYIQSFFNKPVRSIGQFTWTLVVGEK